MEIQSPLDRLPAAGTTIHQYPVLEKNTMAYNAHLFAYPGDNHALAAARADPAAVLLASVDDSAARIRHLRCPIVKQGWAHQAACRRDVRL